MSTSYNTGFPKVNNSPETEQSSKTKNADDFSLAKETASWGHDQTSEGSWVFALYEELGRGGGGGWLEVDREMGGAYRWEERDWLGKGEAAGL